MKHLNRIYEWVFTERRQGSPWGPFQYRQLLAVGITAYAVRALSGRRIYGRNQWWKVLVNWALLFAAKEATARLEKREQFTADVLKTYGEIRDNPPPEPRTESTAKRVTITTPELGRIKSYGPYTPAVAEVMASRWRTAIAEDGMGATLKVAVEDFNWPGLA